MVTPNGRTMTTTSISADRNMAILLILVLNGKIHPEKRHNKKNSLMLDSKETYLSKEMQSGDETEEYRGRNTEQTQNEKVDNIESNPDVRGSASEECGGGFGQPCKALDHRSHL